MFFRFLCSFVHKRKNDKTEVEFRFSFFVFLFSKKQKPIKRKSKFVYLFLEKDSIKQKKKQILSNFCFGGIRFMDSRKETRTSGILAIFGDFTIIFKCKNSLAPSYYKISIKRCF